MNKGLIENVILCTMFIILLRMSIVDAKTHRIPAKYTLFMYALALGHIMVNYPDIKEYVASLGWFGGSVHLIFFLTKGKGIGGGDVKLITATSLLLGIRKEMVALLVSLTIGCFVHFILGLLHKGNDCFPFSPYYTIGICVSFCATIMY